MRPPAFPYSSPRTEPRHLCDFLPRGILSAEESPGRMPLRARLAFLRLVTVFVVGYPAAWAQAPAPAKKPPSPSNPSAAPTAPQSKHYPILLLASGNNPAWSLRIGQKGPERLDRPGYPPILLEAAEVTNEPAGEAWTYHAKDTGTGASVAIHLSREACSDAMSATKYTFRAVVEDPQLGNLSGCARIAAELFPRIINQSEDDPDDPAKKKPAPETTVTNSKPPTAVAYITALGKIIVSRGAVKKVAGAGSDLALSHDGKKLLYVRSETKSSPESTIVLYDFDTGRSRDLVRGNVRQPFWSLDDSRIAYLSGQEQKWQVWSLQVATPEAPTALYANNVSNLQGWVDTHELLVTDLQNAYWLGDDGKVTQTVPLRDIYGSNFEVRDSDTIRVNPGNPDLLLVSANYLAGPLGVASSAKQPVGSIFLYELRTRRRVVLTPPEQSAHHGEWSRDSVQIFYSMQLSSGTSMTYRVFWDGSATKRYVAASDFVVGQ
jgi:uncharacterized membrane protein